MAVLIRGGFIAILFVCAQYQPVYAQKKNSKRLPFVCSFIRVYEYNLDNKLLGQHQPIRDGKLAPSIQGHGHELTKSQREWLLHFLKEDLDLIESGLAKCYIPHHAFVFFDSTMKPVAYVSACLLCDGIDQSWVPKPEEPKYNKKTLARAENQMKRLGAFINSFGFPTEMAMDAYPKYAEKKQLEQDKANKDAVVLVSGDFWKNCFRAEGPAGAKSMCSQSVIEKIKVASEDGVRYQTQVVSSGNIIAWDDESELPRMVELTSPDCWLNNGLQVGMRVEEFVKLTNATTPFNATEVLIKDESVNFDFRITFYGGLITRISGMRYH